MSTPIPASRFGFGGQVTPAIAAAGIPSNPGSSIHDRPSAESRMSPAQKQQLLKSYGWAIGAVDGKWGPRSQGAWNNYQAALGKGIDFDKAAKYWSNNSRLSKLYRSPASTGGGGGGGDVAAHDIPDAPTATAPAGSSPDEVAAPAGRTLKFDLRGIMNPTKYARNSVDAEYGPQIAELIRSRDRSSSTGREAVSNIQDWYKTMLGEYGALDKSNEDQQAASLAGFDSAAAGLAGAFGGGSNDANIGAGGWAQAQRGFLTQQGQNQDDYSTNMRKALLQQGVDSQYGIQQEANQADQEYGAKLGDLRAAKGKAYNEAYQTGLSTAADQRHTAINDQITQALAGEQLTGASLGNAKTRQEIAIDNIRIRMGIDGGTETVPAWNKVDPANRTALKDQLTNGWLDDSGSLAKDPLQAYNAWGNIMRGVSGGKWNPYNNAGARQFRNSLLQALLPTWNQAHPKKQYVFKAGRLVTKKK